MADGAAGARGRDAAIDPRSPEYLARLARWTRARPTEVEGLYTSPIHPWAAAHVTAWSTELVTNYALDGVHLDYVRFPDEDFDYSRSALQQFKRAIRPELSASRSTAGRRAGASESAAPTRTVSASAGPSFRQSRLTALVMRVRTAVKAVRPDRRRSAPRWCRIWQHADGFAPAGLAHVARPVARRRAVPDGLHAGRRRCSSSRSATRRTSRGDAPGVGGHRRLSAQSAAATLQHIAAARRLQARGRHSLFVRRARHSAEQRDSLPLGRAAFGAQLGFGSRLAAETAAAMMQRARPGLTIW